MRYISIDLGDKRTGVAAGDDVTGTVTPIAVVHARQERDRAIALSQIIREHEPHAIVIGLPLNMDGSEGAAAAGARAFGNELHLLTQLPVHFQDERLTSYAADQSMAQSGRTHKQKKELRDALAAAEILRDYFDSCGM